MMNDYYTFWSQNCRHVLIEQPDQLSAVWLHSNHVIHAKPLLNKTNPRSVGIMIITADGDTAFFDERYAEQGVYYVHFLNEARNPKFLLLCVALLVKDLREYADTPINTINVICTEEAPSIFMQKALMNCNGFVIPEAEYIKLSDRKVMHDIYSLDVSKDTETISFPKELFEKANAVYPTVKTLPIGHIYGRV